MSKIKEAFNVIKQEMMEEVTWEPGSYAHSWHCNIAQCCYDAMKFHDPKLIETHFEANQIANDAASRFMKLCFDVETSG